MTIYVAEISGRAIAGLNAESPAAAEDWLADSAFHSELLRLRDEDDNPLWDGEGEIRVRPASSREEKTWRTKRAKAVADHDAEAKVLMFLIPVFDNGNRKGRADVQ